MLNRLQYSAADKIKRILKMKSIITSIIIILLIGLSGRISSQEIKLKALIDSALSNRGNIRAVRTDIEIARLQTSSVYQKYLPDLSLSYNYRYNPIVPTQIIPVGQFNPVPTDEKRPIKFGTDWQQNSGLNLYQPIIDFSIKSRVAESRINEKLKNTDVAAAERDLKMEVIRSFTNIWLREEQHRYAALDTLRTAKTKELFIVKSKEGKVLKTEVNRAILNHNNALSDYVAVTSSLTREKIYMGFLTGIALESLLDGTFDFSPFKDDGLQKGNTDLLPDSIPTLRSLIIRAELLEQQKKSERMKHTPTVGFEGFLGASQYADTFNPLLSDSWYGSSYLGLSLRFQILSGSSTKNRVSQLKLEQKGLKSKLEDETNSFSNKSLLLMEEIKQIEYQTELSKQNIMLYEENLSLNKDRFEKGQINAYDLLTDEIDFQKEQSKFNEKRAELVFKQIELINNSGALSSFIDNLR
jgi:outer membrane protein